MAIVIVNINGTAMQGQGSYTGPANVDLYVTTNITNKPGIGRITSSSFPPSVLDGDPILQGGWILKWGSRQPGQNKTLLVENPNDPSDTAQVTLNDS